MFDQHENFAYSTVAVAPSPALSGTSLDLQPGDGALFPAAPFNCTVWPAGVAPLDSNAEIVRVTAKTGDTLTIVRTQEGSSARAIVVGDQIANTITKKVITDIEGAIPSDSRFEGYATTQKNSGTTTLTAASQWAQFFTENFAAGQTVALPVTSTLYLGFEFLIVNKAGNGQVIVNSSGGNVITGLNPGEVYILTCIAISGTGAASWDAIQISGFATATDVGFIVNAAILAAQFPSPSVVGTAIFDGRGSITGLVMTGIITDVTYNSTGKYDVVIETQTLANYLALAQVYDNGDIGGATLPPTASIPNDSITTSGFQVQVVAGGTLLSLPVLDDSVARRVQVTVIR